MNPNSILENIIWLFVGIFVTLFVEWVVRDGISRVKRAFLKWREGPPLGPFDDTMILIKPSGDGATFTLLNGGTRTYRNVVIRNQSAANREDFVGFSPYADQQYEPIAQRGKFSPDQSITIDPSRAGAPTWTLNWSATYDAPSWARRVVDRVTNHKRPTWGIIGSSDAVPHDRPLQEYLLKSVRGLFGLAAEYPKTPAPEVEARILALTDEEASRVLKSERTFADPMPGVSLKSGVGGSSHGRA